MPVSWTIEAPHGDGGRPVVLYNTDEYSTLGAACNTVHPAGQQRAQRLRIRMQPRHDASVGILSVDIHTTDNEEVDLDAYTGDGSMHEIGNMRILGSYSVS